MTYTYTCKKCGNEFTTKRKSRTLICRDCQFSGWRKDKNKERRAKHLCIDCGGKVKPLLYYPCRCKDCKARTDENLKKYRKEHEIKITHKRAGAIKIECGKKEKTTNLTPTEEEIEGVNFA